MFKLIFEESIFLQLLLSVFLIVFFQTLNLLSFFFSNKIESALHKIVMKYMKRVIAFIKLTGVNSEL